MSKILQSVTLYGMDILLCALLTFVLTGVVKTPLKALASRSTNYRKYTRFLTFLPIAVGFGVSVAYTYFENLEIVFDDLFFTRWLSSVSCSLAFYAFWEKFVPSKKKILEEEEIAANKAFVKRVEEFLITKGNEGEVDTNVSETGNSFLEHAAPAHQEPVLVEDGNASAMRKKIVLHGGEHAVIKEE